jgi:hypothetical protein
MGYVIAGIAVAIVFLFAAQRFTQANPATLARWIKILGAALAVSACTWLVSRGQIGAAAFVGYLAYAVISGRGWPGGPSWAPSQPSAGKTSQLRTDHLELELDHDTGAVRGRVLKGIFQGRDIESLSPADVALLWQDCRFNDPQSAQVLEAYLDRIHPEWREDVKRGEEHLAGGPDGRMTREQAFEILGLKPEANEDEIRRAHRELMKRMHPDQGGSNYLAAKINEAKDVLLGS